MLEGKTAVVTGAGRGIGRAVAEALAGAGASVVLASRNDAELAEAAMAVERCGQGRPALAVPTDVRAAAQVEALFSRATEYGGGEPPSILVNCAGRLLDRRLVDTGDDEWAEVLTTNLTSVFFACRAFGRRLRAERRPGRVVNVSSIFGHRGVPGYAAYAASKAGIDGLTRTLAVEWASSGIRVNSVSPGHVDTAMSAALADPVVERYVLGRIPAGRVAKPEEVADLVVYLASPAAELITGQTIILDGGYTIG